MRSMGRKRSFIVDSSARLDDLTRAAARSEWSCDLARLRSAASGPRPRSSRREGCGLGCTCEPAIGHPFCRARRPHDRRRRALAGPDPAAFAFPRTQSGGEYLAIHARKLALKHRLRRLRRHHRRRLRRSAKARRSARSHHFNRNEKMGPCRSRLVAVGVRRYSTCEPIHRAVKVVYLRSAFPTRRGREAEPVSRERESQSAVTGA